VNTPTNTPTEPVTIAEIARFTAWARRLSAALSAAGRGATDNAELAAFHTAKARLFARIEDQHPHTVAPNPAQPRFHPRGR